MRAIWLGAILLAACGDAQAPAEDDTPERVADPDEFLDWLPEGTTSVLRLPPAADVAARAGPYRDLLRAFGRDTAPALAFFRTEQPDGLDAKRGPGLALLPGGGWVHYLPAKDKGALNRALADRIAGLGVREQGPWVVLAKDAPGPGEAKDAPLPAGDLALRVHHHPLLALLAEPGDTLELGLDVQQGGFGFEGRLVPGSKTETGSYLAAAGTDPDGLLDPIPGSLALRVETSLPPTFLAAFVARRLAIHLGVKEAKDRVTLERFVREVLTGVGPGLGLGFEFKDGDTTFVAIGRRAEGDDSPILARLRGESRSSFGVLVLDRREAPKGLVGWTAWVAEAEPSLEGAPEVALNAVAALSREDEGFLVAYAEWRGWCILGGGPRADLLVRAVRSRVARGASRSGPAFDLLYLRDRDVLGDYVFGAIVHGPGLAGLPAEDRAKLGALLGATRAASAPASVVVAGFRDGEGLALAGRVRYFTQ